MGDTDFMGEMTDEDWAYLTNLDVTGEFDAPPPSGGEGLSAGVVGYTPMTPDEQRFSDQEYWDDLYGPGFDMESMLGASPDGGAAEDWSGERSLLEPSRNFLSEDYTTKAPPPTVTGSISGQYGDPTSPYYTGATPPSGAFDPTTGAYGPAEVKGPSGVSKVGSFLKNLFMPEPEVDKNGRPIQRSPSSSPAGIAAGAADKSATNRLAEAKLALERDQTNANLYGTQQSATLRASEIEMMRKRLTNAQRARSEYVLRMPGATEAQKAEARASLAKLDSEFAPTSALVLPPPGATPMPTRPWWETALATAGLAGTTGEAVGRAAAGRR